MRKKVSEFSTLLVLINYLEMNWYFRNKRICHGCFLMFLLFLCFMAEMIYRQPLKQPTIDFLKSNNQDLSYASATFLNVMYLLIKHVFLMAIFLIYFDKASRESSFHLLFVITINTTLANILKLFYFEPVPAYEYPFPELIIHRCTFKFGTPASPTFEYCSLISYLASDFFWKSGRTNRFGWFLFWVCANITCGFLTSLVNLYLGLNFLSSIVFGWSLGSVVGCLLHFPTRLVKPMIAEYMKGIELCSKKKITMHILIFVSLTSLFIAVPILTFQIRKYALPEST